MGKASAAWSERDRRGSALEYQVAHGRVKASDSHRKWTRRNRIHDSSYGGSSSEGEGDDGGVGAGGGAGRAEQSAAANALLYVGLGTTAIGLVIAFVGTGEKGFKTLELRLIGPTLIAGGLLCCLLRILLCVCPSVQCLRFGKRRGKRRPPDEGYYRHLPYRSRTAGDFLLAEPPPPLLPSTAAQSRQQGDKKRVSIVQTPGAAGDRRPVRSSSTWRGGGGPSGTARGGPLADLVGCEGDSVELLELRSCGGAGAAAELHSASSEDSFNESLALVTGAAEPPRDERLARLKSTLTFQDDVDDYDACAHSTAAAASTCPRIDEEREDEMTSSHSASPQPPQQLPHHQPLPSTSFARRELVLSPAKLQHI